MNWRIEMKVYVVISMEYEEYMNIEKIFISEQKALDYSIKLMTENEIGALTFYVQQHEVVEE